MPVTKPAKRAAKRAPVRSRGDAPAAKGEGSRAEAAYRRLFEAIETGAVAPGSRLREIELSSWLGLSRTPVRAALGRLEGEGLIARDASRGLAVASLDQDHR